jgi:outer membrane protein TolC
VIDLNVAVQNALANRTDVQQARKNIEANDINIRFFRNQTLPDVNAQVDYFLAGLGGTQIQRGVGIFGPGTGDQIGSLQRSYGAVLTDLFANRYPVWTLSLNIGYPIGTSTAEANLARARLQHTQAQTQLKNQELQVATQVRDLARHSASSHRHAPTSCAPSRTTTARSWTSRRCRKRRSAVAAGFSRSGNEKNCLT